MNEYQLYRRSHNVSTLEYLRINNVSGVHLLLTMQRTVACGQRQVVEGIDPSSLGLTLSCVDGHCKCDSDRELSPFQSEGLVNI